MSEIYGNDGSFKLSTVATAKVTNWTATINAQTQSKRYCDDDGWDTVYVTGHNWEGSCSGDLDFSDTNQAAIFLATISGTAMDDLRLYDGTYWLEPDTDTNANATTYITKFEYNDDPSGLFTFSLSFIGSGPCHRVAA